MKIIISLIVLFLSVTTSVSADFEITEIMYDLEGTDTNREWVEVKNTGSEAADLSKWYLFSANTKHALSPQGPSSVPVGGYAIITQNMEKFKIDWPNFTGLLFDSSWTGFTNESGTISLKDPNLNFVSSVTYSSTMGAAGDGNSLNKTDTEWKPGAPTPGQVPGTLGNNPVPEPTGGTETIAASVFEKKKKEIEPPSIKTEIISNTNAFATLTFPMKASTTGYLGEPLLSGRFLWNFGDGSVRDQKFYYPFDYTYAYSGEYIVTLSYYENYLTSIPAAVDRMTITVVDPDVTISSVGTSESPFIELENKTTLEVPLSQWMVKAGIHSFVIPHGTVILSGKKMKLSPKITGFVGSDITSIILQNPNAEIMDSFSVVPQQVSRAISSVKAVSQTKSVTALFPAASVAEASASSTIDLDDLTAAAGKTRSQTPSSVFAWIGLAVVIVLGLGSVWLMSKKKAEESLGIENTTSEDEIETKNITIIE